MQTIGQVPGLPGGSLILKEHLEPGLGEPTGGVVIGVDDGDAGSHVAERPEGLEVVEGGPCHAQDSVRFGSVSARPHGADGGDEDETKGGAPRERSAHAHEYTTRVSTGSAVGRVTRRVIPHEPVGADRRHPATGQRTTVKVRARSATTRE